MMSLGSEPLLLPPPPLRLGVAKVLRESVAACCGECLRCRLRYFSSSRTSMMMMMMKMTLPEAMPTKMATSEPMALDFPFSGGPGSPRGEGSAGEEKQEVNLIDGFRGCGGRGVLLSTKK